MRGGKITTLSDLINKCECGINRFRIIINDVATLDIMDLDTGEEKMIFNENLIVTIYNIQAFKEETVMYICLKIEN